MTKFAAVVHETQKMVVVYGAYTIIRVVGPMAVQIGRAAFTR